MNLIIGGAYQGKLEYAIKQYNLDKTDICDCSSGNADLSKRCIYHYEKYVLNCVRSGETPQLPEGADTIVIADDIFCGVVPIDADIRAWREACGRALTAIAEKSESVTRLFCGLPMKIK